MDLLFKFIGMLNISEFTILQLYHTKNIVLFYI